MAKRLKLQDSVNNIKKYLKTGKHPVKFTNNAKMSAMNSVTTTTDSTSDDSLTSLNITYLKPPTKSVSDKKEYSVIRLINKVTCLLISDVSNIVNINDVLGSEDEHSISESEQSSSEDDSSSCEEDSHDTAEMSVDNKHDKKKLEEKLSACALCIGVGSFSDPEDIPGLAHFVEHMVFMGSEKYPKENEFDSFIKKRGGSDNASTDCEHTTFYFECHEVHMENALDIFSQFFVSPLMKRESMSKERESIESEFRDSFGSDGHRRAEILATTAHHSNPAHKFAWGNLITLRDNITDDKLYSSAHKFKKKHYSAHRMTVAIQARLPIETLEEWAIKYFSNIPYNNLSPDIFQPSEPFQNKEFCKLYTIEPVKDITQVELTWALPPVDHLYKSKPLDYIVWVIQHEGEGSLLSYLKKKLWALNIIASSGEDESEQNSIFTLFSICLHLTNDGINNLYDVLTCVFQYLKMFKENGVEERIFNEIKLVADMNFRFAQEVSAADNVEDLALSMHYYPSEDYITGSELYFEYKPELIKSFLDKLTCDMVNIMVSSKYAANKIKLDRTEPWYGTKYNVSDIPTDWIKQWRNIESGSHFHLPHPNQFLTKDFAILSPPDYPPEYPIKIIQDEILEVWYKQDVKFKRPLGYMCFHLISNIFYISPKNAAMLDLFIAILKQLLSEILYPANMAQLNYAVRPGERGILIAVDGYNEKLDDLLKVIIKIMLKFSISLTPELFNAMKDELKKIYYNSCLKTGFLNRDIRMSILLHNYWGAVDKYKAIADLTCESLKLFSNECFQHLYIESLIQGNISKEKAIKICNDLQGMLQCKPLLPNTKPEIRVCQLPIGDKYCRVQSFANNSNCTVTSYYQSGPATIADVTTVELLIRMMDEPLFDTLRTQKQLGYDVSCSLRETFGVLGFSVTVHSQANKNTVDYVADAITEFLHEFLIQVRSTSEEEFQDIRQSLIKSKLCVDDDIKDEFKRNWGEITSNEYIFDRLIKEKMCAENLTLYDVCNWLERHICAINNLRKLCVQVVGNLKNTDNGVNILVNDSEESLVSSEQWLRSIFESRKESEADQIESSDVYMNVQNSSMDLKFHLEDCNSHEKYICDIQNFKKKLIVFPVLKITKC